MTGGEAVMLKPLIVAAVVAVSATISKAEEPPKQYVEAITIEEFAKLPFDSQVMYVAGDKTLAEKLKIVRRRAAKAPLRGL